jgi:N-acetylmuramoyl-L-alanine amidase
MKIIGHRLCQPNGKPFPFVLSPNCEDGLQPEYLVVHYTSGRSAEGAVNWLTNPASQASAHLVIGRDARITQLVSFDKIAWHAGTSFWEGREGLNRYAIGIELDNAGRLTRHGTKWRAWFGGEYDDSEVIEAVHKNEREPCGWHLFTPEQLQMTFQIASLLVAEYGLLDMVGHDDIAPFRKSDPGPAFPMQNIRAALMGRRENADVQYETIAVLNIRTGPGTQYRTIPGSPLPIGTRLEILDRRGVWALVDVLGVVNDVMDMQGWVHTRYIARVFE